MKEIISLMFAVVLPSVMQVKAADFQIMSPAFKHQGEIPDKYTCDNEQQEVISPALSWTGVPSGTKSFVLIIHDPDAPSGPKDHWIVFNLPASTTYLAEGIDKLPAGTRFGKKSFPPNEQYKGPCPPDREHRYFFKLYALDQMLNLPNGASKQDIGAAMRKHILAQTELMGRYNRPQNIKK